MFKKTTASGSKAYQRTDTENRIKPYSDWHRTLDRKLLMLDVDFIEWRYRNGQLVAVGVMEVTRVDNGKQVNEQYLSAIINRFETRDLQARAAKQVAAALKTHAYILLFREDCTEFWIYNLSTPNGWKYLEPEQMHNFLKSL